MRFKALIILLITITACDPVHDLKIENQTDNSVEVVFFPDLDSQKTGGKVVEKVVLQGQEMNMITLGSAETIRIGTVVARYRPTSTDIDLNYLEVRYGLDTIRLTGKNAILSTIQQVDKLDWRLIVKLKTCYNKI